MSRKDMRCSCAVSGHEASPFVCSKAWRQGLVGPEPMANKKDYIRPRKAP